MRSLELFAGCGGLAFGLSQAGFQPVLVVESDRETVATLRANVSKRLTHVRNWPIWEGDVRDLNFSNYKGVELISGGPPCQPFSIGGKHLGPKDVRNMWPEATRAVREIMPRAFLFENVRGLLRPAFDHYFEYIVKQLQYPHIAPKRDERWTEHLARLRQHASSKRATPSAYKVLARGINAADYGAPQKRYRTLVIGVAAPYGEGWSFPESTHSQDSLVWSKHVTCEYWDRHEARRISKPSTHAEAVILRRIDRNGDKPKCYAWKTVRDVLADLPPPMKRCELLQGHWQHKGARTYRNHTGSDWDEPAKALKAGDHGVPGGENLICNRRGTPRYFTVREMARLQCLPDSYEITGSWKAATRQLGNAVPAIVGRVVGKHIERIINGQQGGQPCRKISRI